MRNQENYIVSATKVIIETHLEVKRYYNYSDSMIKKTTIRVHYRMEKISKLTVPSMNYQKTGFH